MCAPRWRKRMLFHRSSTVCAVRRLDFSSLIYMFRCHSSDWRSRIERRCTHGEWMSAKNKMLKSDTQRKQTNRELFSISNGRPGPFKAFKRIHHINRAHQSHPILYAWPRCHGAILQVVCCDATFDTPIYYSSQSTEFYYYYRLNGTCQWEISGSRVNSKSTNEPIEIGNENEIEGMRSRRNLKMYCQIVRN